MPGTLSYSWSARALAVVVYFWISAASVEATGERPWSEKDTRLASEYLNILAEKPENGRVLDLLWELYDKHQSTGLLLESIAAQAKAQPHANVLLVRAHLLRKAGRVAEAGALYQQVAAKDGRNAIALRALADLALDNSQRVTALGYLDQLAATMKDEDPQLTPLLVEKGRVALAAGRADEAAVAWSRAVKLRPGDDALSREVAQLFLGSGFLDRALELYRALAKSADPAKRLDALYDLSRIEEQGDHFPEAAASLREGLALLHFRDWRYARFFERLVRLHERFGQLDALKDELRRAAGDPPQEKALADLARFAELTVDADEQIRWLRDLVKNFPAAQDHRQRLVQALMDHDGWQEAAKLLDEQLKNDGSDTVALVLLRSQAELRAGDEAGAVRRLKQALKNQANLDAEKQVLAFAREKSLDAVTEEILRTRVARDPGKAESVMDLAAFYRARQRQEDVIRTLDEFTREGGVEKVSRINQAAAFLAGGADPRAAEKTAREAVRVSHGGREELLRLADVLTQDGPDDEAMHLLEKAWALSDTPEKRTDVDERIFAMLSGSPASRPAQASASSQGEFKLPPVLTGEGFGSDAPPAEKTASVNDAVLEYAAAQALRVQGPDFPARFSAFIGKLPSWIRPAMMAGASSASVLFTRPEPSRILRAAWWCFRADRMELAASLLNLLEPDAPLEAQKLWLDMALQEKNTLLALRQLRLLSRMDPAGRTGYQLRLAEQQIARGEGAALAALTEAQRILEELAKTEPQNETVLSALAQCYMAGGRRDEVVALWEKAVRDAKGNVTPLLERLAEALVMQRRFKDFVAIQARLVEEETDLKRRRENFQRALDRLMWTESRRGEVDDDEKKERLGIVAAEFRARSQAHPFDGFWHEALAQVYERQGDAAKAFAEMKQAYYTAPDTPFSLGQLRSSALRAGEIRSAIYFQKQIAAAAPASQEAGEWRELVQLLEQDFRMDEADQVRRRLESRFSQDAAALEELGHYYSETSQEDAAGRVYQQIARVRPWEPRNLLRLAVARRKLGENAQAVEALQKLLGEIPVPPDMIGKMPVDKLPWPLVDDEKSRGIFNTSISSMIDFASGLEATEREQLRLFLSMPRDEFLEVPDNVAHVRLRAVEELARLGGKPADAARLSDMEMAWWNFYSGAGVEFRAQLAPCFPAAGRNAADPVEQRFLFAWLAVRSHGMAEAIRWVHPAGVVEEVRRGRAGVLQTVVNILAENGPFEFTRVDLETLGSASWWSASELINTARRLENRRRHEEALALGEAALRRMTQPAGALLQSLAVIAASAGKTEDERRYFKELWQLPLTATAATGFSGPTSGIHGRDSDPEKDLLWYYERLGRSVEAAPPRPTDAFVTGLEGMLRLARTPEERGKLLVESWRRLRQPAPSGMGAVREARVLGFAGAGDAAAEIISRYLGGDYLTSRAYLEPLFGRLPAMEQLPGSRIDEVNHMRSYWDDLREWGVALDQAGMSSLAAAADTQLSRSNGGVPLGPRTNPEFNAWRLHALMRKLRKADYPQRIQLVREYFLPDDSAETLTEAGNQLEARGYVRESIEAYRRLPGRAPSNAEYSKNFLHACEASWDIAPALPYLERMFDPAVDPVFKPLTINFEELREQHARFLAMMHQEQMLRDLAWRETPPVKAGRIPEQVPYLKEYALLLERRDDKAEALAAWEQLCQRWPEDEDAALHRAQHLAAQGRRDRALEVLRKMTMPVLWTATAREALELRARLLAEASAWEELRELMNFASTPVASSSGTIMPRPVDAALLVSLSRILDGHGRKAEAASLLVRGERAAKEEPDRFRLRLEQVRLSSKDAAWDPQREAARIAAVLRIETEDESALMQLRDWVGDEARAGRSNSWLELLKNSRPNPNVTLALAATGRAAEAGEQHFAHQRPHSGVALRLAAETLLKNGQPALALRLVDAPSPLAVRVLGAMNDEHGLREIFFRITRMEFPGGPECVDYAEAFAGCGRAGLAAEVYDLAQRRLHATGQALPALVKSHAKFLISQRRLEEAETMLLQEHQGVTRGLAEILVDLYREWNKLDRIGVELAKFHLPSAVVEEVKYLAAREQKKS